MRQWFRRLFRLLPTPRFDPKEVLVDGWPWDVRIPALVLIHSTMGASRT